ncbi:MAG: hypothetical protein JXA08_08380 [Methanomicrobiaceae archaeon]|nr:hypothetical protein [Methanomicrobiaceae archaeon]
MSRRRPDARVRQTGGHRPRSTEGHVPVREFLSHFLPRDDVTLFDRMRRKRHTATYDMSFTVTHTDAENAVHNARDLVHKIGVIILKDGFSL